MSNSKGIKKQGPRGSRGDVDTVRRNAAAAGRQLEAEQEESVAQLAQALGEISEGEALAHLDSRLAFVERQVDRLTARRDETDRGTQGELAVMRARIEDAMEAVGATAEQQKDALNSLEKRLAGIVSEAERGSADVVESLRREIVSKVQDTANRLDKLDARIRGEMKAFEDGFDERSRALTGSIEEKSETFDERLTEAAEDLQAQLEETSARVVERLEKHSGEQAALLQENEAELASARARMVEDFTARVSEIESKIAQTSEEAGKNIEEAHRRLETTIAEAEHRSQEVSEKADALVVSIDERLEGERREIEGRLSEWGAELRLETQRMREAVENRSKAVAEALDVVRRDLLARVQASEEKAAGAAIRLQSLIDQSKRELVSDEEEWSGLLTELGDDMSQLKIRVEELAGRVSAAEARRAAERGSSNANAEGFSARVEALEQKVRDAVEEMVAKQGTRLEMLASQVASMSETEVAAEEQFGSVEYLKRRVGEMAERLDEIVVKVNAIGRYVTKPGGAARIKGDQLLPGDLDQRLESIERAVEQLADRQASAQVAPELLNRIENLEKSVAGLDVPRPSDSEIAGMSDRLAALEKSIAELNATLAERTARAARPDFPVRVEEPRRKETSSTILPSKKRRW